MAAAVIQPHAELPQRQRGKHHADKQNRLTAVVPVRGLPLATESPEVANQRHRRRQRNPRQRRVAEQAHQPGNQFTIGEQAAQRDQQAGQRRPEGIAAQSLPVKGAHAQSARQPLAFRVAQLPRGLPFIQRLLNHPLLFPGYVHLRSLSL